MKKIIKLLSLSMVLFSVLFIQSCKDDEGVEPAPSVALDASSGSNTPGNKVSVTSTVSAPNGGQSLVVYINGVETETFEIGGAKDFEKAFEYTVPASAVIGSTIILSFQAVDTKNYPSAIANYTLTVGDPIIVLQGNLATQTLDATKPYLLKGQVFIPSGVTITVPAGTVVKGDKASKAVLVVQPGGKLIANGTATNPVVFTSAQAVGERDRGDWGGIVMLGDAWVNQSALPAVEGITPSQTYGNITSPTTNANQNAGTLTYVRIEYAGIELTPNNETNSLTMGGVGNGTTIDHVQVSFGGDDGFEWFGGTVNGKHLVSLSTWDDDFDTDFGWGGNVQFGLVVRNPFFADQSGSNAFESDNQANANDTPQGSAGYTRGIFSNITVLGPRDFNSPARSISANYQNAMHIRRRSALSIFNSVFSGFRLGLRIDDQATLDNLNNSTSKIAYNVLLVPGTKVTGTASSDSEASFVTGLSSGDASAIKTYWDNNNNTTMNPTSGSGTGSWNATDNPYTALGISPSLFWGGQSSSNYPSNPNFALTSGTLATGANFSDVKLSGNSFFESVNYKGAFGTTDWTDGWAEFQPLNKAY
jgi:hypothetical protein